MGMLSIYVALLALISLVTAKTAIDFSAPETPVIFSCLSMIESSYRFGYLGPESIWAVSCMYPPKVATYTTCFTESSLDFNNTLTAFLSVCLTFGNVDITKDELYKIHTNGSQYLLDPMKGDVTGEILYQPVRPDFVTLQGYFKLYDDFFNSIERASRYGQLLNNYWIIVLLIISFFNLLKSTRLNHILKYQIISKFRSFFTIPTFTSNHLQAYNTGVFETLLPTLQEFYLLAIYFGVCIYGASTEYVVLPHNPLLGDKISQWTRYIADRTGILAFTQLPLLFLFGGRNNLLIKITGLPYSSFIMFHKWISRLMVSCAVLHGVCYIIYALHLHRILIDLNELYWICGCIALTAALGIMIQAFYKFRKICYEWFLIIHIGLLLMFICCCIAHCWKIGWLQYCYYSVLFWGVDRILRVGRLWQFGFPQAKVEIMSTVDPTLKITIPKPEKYKTFAGSYVFIHFLSMNFKIWESHPFTIYEVDNQISIILKPKLGMTMNLYKYLLNHKDHKFDIRVAIEGPYGHHVSKKYSQQVMLLAGGNGIPGPFYHALSMMAKDDERDKSRVKLCWVTRDLESLKWFNLELQMIMNKIDIDIYVTRERIPTVASYDSITSESVTKNAELEFFQLNSNINFYNWRPDFYKLLQNEILEKGLSDMTVISCGNPTMCDGIRNCCADLINEFTGVRLDLYEELQVW